MILKELGFEDFFMTHFNNYKDKGLVPARVISQQKNNYLICCEKGTINTNLSGKFLYKASMKKDFPAVGDWVAVKLSDNDTQGTIHAVLPRKTVVFLGSSGVGKSTVTNYLIGEERLCKKYNESKHCVLRSVTEMNCHAFLFLANAE